MTMANIIMNSTTAVLAILKVNEVSGVHNDIIQRIAAADPEMMPINCPSLKNIVMDLLFSVIFKK
ncbi:MAG: hypothetical protein HKN08_06500 [Gammaproteobacteria bacterium]|nr:hypothetical protein [Gammaproteobacteria bacterium]